MTLYHLAWRPETDAQIDLLLYQTVYLNQVLSSKATLNTLIAWYSAAHF